MSATSDPKDKTSFEDAGTPLTQGGSPAFDSPDGYGDPVSVRDGQPRTSFEDDAGPLPQGGPQPIDLANLPGNPDAGVGVREQPASFEDAVSFVLSLEPEFSTITQDVDAHYHFAYTKPYLAQYCDATLDPWNTPTLNGFTGYGRDGYRYTNGVKDGDARLIGVSNVGQKLYHRIAGSWAVFPNQPVLTGGTLGHLCVGIPTGGIVVWRGVAGSEFCHYNVTTNTWSYKAKASSAAVGASGSGYALDATHVYAWGGGRVEKFDGTSWSNLTPTALTNDPNKGWAQSADVLWVCPFGYGNLHHYIGGVWTDRWSELVAAIGNIGGYPLTSMRDVWTYGSNVYCLCHHSATSRCYIVKYNGSTWTLLGGGGVFYDVTNIWGTDDSHIWVHGRGPTDASHIFVGFWNGSTWATQLSGPGTAGIQYTGKRLFGTGPQVIAGSFYTSAVVVYETTDGVNWTQPTWPDSTPAQVISATDFSGVTGGLTAPWRTEASGANRSSRGDFPVKSLLVVTQQELVIFDLDTFDGSVASLRVWMRFLLGNDVSNFWALGRGVDSIVSVAFSNGLLVVGTKDTGWESGRLHTVDFKALTPATVFSLLGNDGQWIGQGTKTIVDRNTNSIWLSSGSNRITPSEVRSVAVLPEGTNTHYIAVAGEDPGPQLVKFTGNVVQYVYSAAGENLDGSSLGDYRRVLFDDVGWLWFSIGSVLYRNCRDWREGYMYPTKIDTRQGLVDLGVTITHLVYAKESIYAGTANGIYRIHKGTMEAYLAYTAPGGGGRGRLNVAASGELFAGSRSKVQSLKAFTLLRGTTVVPYLSVGTYFDGSTVGAYTMIRLWDDVVVRSYVAPYIIEPGTFISSAMLA